MMCDASLAHPADTPANGLRGTQADRAPRCDTPVTCGNGGNCQGEPRRAARYRGADQEFPNSDQWSTSPTLGAVPRGDGRLNHDLLPGEKGPQDACGVFGVWAPGEEVAKLTYFGLYALQHRGQESAGIAVSNGSQILVFKDMGLVSQVFDETSLGSLQGHIAVGHARYSTTGASVWENAQPTFRATAQGSIALGHNGNLVNTAKLAEMVAELPNDNNSRSTRVAATNDTDLLTA